MDIDVFSEGAVILFHSSSKKRLFGLKRNLINQRSWRSDWQELGFGISF
jgi:hypothetical protein